MNSVREHVREHVRDDSHVRDGGSVTAGMKNHAWRENKEVNVDMKLFLFFVFSATETTTC